MRSSASRNTAKRGKTTNYDTKQAGRMFQNFVVDALLTNKDENAKEDYARFLLQGTQDTGFGRDAKVNRTQTNSMIKSSQKAATEMTTPQSSSRHLGASGKRKTAEFSPLSSGRLTSQTLQDKDATISNTISYSRMGHSTTAVTTAGH